MKISSLAIVLCLTAHAWASPSVSLTVTGEAPCPDADGVATTLAAVVPEARITPLGQLRAQVEDLGASYRVSLGSTVRTIADPDRRCDERARTTALLVAMRLSANESAPPLVERDEVPLAALPRLPELRERALRRRAAGRSLLAVGVVTLSISVALGLTTALYPRAVYAYGVGEDHTTDGLLGSTLVSAALGVSLLGAGIALWSGGKRDFELASDSERYLRAEATRRAIPAPAIVRGHRLLRAGGGLLSLSLAAGTVALIAALLPREVPDGLATATGSIAAITSAVSIGLFAAGGHVLAKHDERPRVRLSIGLGAIAGVF